MSNYRNLLNSLGDLGFCIIEIIFNEKNKPIDYRFLEMNAAFEKQTGLKNALGKTAREILPNLEEHWFEIYGKVATTGEPIHFENVAKELHRYFNVYAYRFGQPEENKVAVFFNDIKEKVEAEIKLGQTLNELEINEERLKDALRIANMGYVETDIPTGNVFWSYEVYKIFERPLEAGPPSIEEGHAYVHEEDKERIMDFVKNIKSSDILEIDYRIKVNGGKIKHLAYYVRPVFQDGKMIKRIGTVQDITDRKLSELELQRNVREKEALLRELYHRVKNNMQIIASLLSLRSDFITNETDRGVFMKMISHVQAMSMVHEKLYQSKNLSRINLGQYIKDLSETLVSTYSELHKNVQIHYNLQDFETLMDIALPCGYAITELIHNSIKYAFPNNTPGNIFITVSKNNNEITIVLSDDGVGMSSNDINESSHLGLMLVRTLVEDQLGGTLRLDNSKGTCWMIKIKDDSYSERV